MAGKNLRGYFLEMLTIVFSITLSFMLNEWRTNAQNESKQIQYLEQFSENLVGDSIKISQEIRDLARIARAADSLFVALTTGREPDSLEYFLGMQPTYSTIPVNDLAYKELVQTGESGLIKNRHLLKELISYYDIHFWEIKEYSAIDRKVVLDRLLPFFEEKLEGLIPIQKNKSALTGQFINIINYNKNFKIRQKALFEEQLKRISGLRIKIETELAHLN